MRLPLITIVLPEEEIKSFIELYRKHYGVEIPYEEASLRANNLMSLYEAVYGEVLANNKESENKNEQNGDKSKSK